MATYDINDTRDLLKQRLARFTSSASLDTYGVQELLQAQQRLEMSAFKPWFLKTLETSLALDAAVSTTVPTGFLGLVDDTDFYLTNADGTTVKIKERRYDDALAEYPLTTTAAQPVRFSVQPDGEIYFFPTPDVTTYTAAFWYYKADTVPATDGAANSWTTNARDLLVAEAGLYISRFYLENPKAAKVFADIIALESARLQRLSAWKELSTIDLTPED